ncbi:MAG: 50S ribosomal protein L11 methyltransferase, partial [Xanthomonadales bacterium]|nr:50S ribosomal protein L11 methyltransferase [Xanthomonadales bacterium]
AEKVSAALEALQALAVTTQSATPSGDGPARADGEILEPDPGTTPLWQDIEVRGLFEADVPRKKVVDALVDSLDLRSPERLTWRTVEDQAWERAWLDRFGPMRFGKRLWIVPRDMPSPAGRGSTVVRLDPGLAFGTGAHATTALCLEWLDGQDLKGKRVVDYGCGSGVLAIAAALKGAARVIAVDNDPQAIEACTLNARHNHVHGQVMPCLPQHYDALLRDTLRGMEGVDVVMANILARPLIQLAPVLTRSLKSGGKLVLSGLLDSQSDSVRRAYRRAFGKLSVTPQDGWARLEGVKRG